MSEVYYYWDVIVTAESCGDHAKASRIYKLLNRISRK